MNDFSTLNSFFDHIYVITLQRAKERQHQIKKNLEGLHYDFFFGADKLNYPVSDLARNGIYSEALSKKNHRYNKTPTGGQICCAWSHKKVYEDVVKKQYQKVLILEDDVVPYNNIGKTSPLLLKELPSTWELLYLDYDKNEKRNPIKQYWYHVQKFFGGLTWSHTTIQNLYPQKISDHLASAGFHDFTSAYAITVTAAEKLLLLQSPIAYLADNLLATACTSKIINGFIAVPKLFSQLSQGSDKLINSFVGDQ